MTATPVERREAHGETIVHEFTRQAAGFEDPLRNAAFTAQLGRLVRFMEPELDPEDVVLEVAAGTALVSRAVAGRVRHATALDLTPAMLAEGKRAADASGVTNMTFTRGDATALPYLDRSFTLVVTRFSLHQVDDPDAVVREMARVARPGAAIVIADLVRPEGLAGDPDRIERQRDPSHGTLRTEAEIAAMLAAAGAEVRRADRFEVVRPLDPWLAFTGTSDELSAVIRKELEAELAGGAPTGMRPVLVDGALHFTHSHAFLQATAG
ncbi:class I SAM-dependent methyltransferase [Actinomadura rupiterrae]|uniref:class I SAM-dependent methyltransferase n=1 Tax=Actinomadura rupiterrae TaxID=559627 RepID=UPI0020A5FB10|nr:methyltransferase domain-containing protein [Actinomadura rupiterrae]MCP2336466.1 ubiquinone/menaquinone biosynthesis C-methylase UbiE [Actinomadura rupiterrae]